MRAQAAAIAQAVPALAPLANIWVNFDADYFQAAATRAENWVRGQIATIMQQVQAAPAAQNRARIIAQLQALWIQLNQGVIRSFPPP